MGSLKVILDKNPTEADKAFLLNSLNQHDSALVGPANTRVFAAYVRDEGQNIVGGGLGTIIWNWVYISHVWIAEEHRGKGYGKQIISMIEEESGKLNCKFSYLATFDFQAVVFYEKLGYQIFGKLDDFPEGHQIIFMKKNFEGKEL